MELLNFTQGDWIIKVIAHYDPEELLQCKQKGGGEQTDKKQSDRCTIPAVFVFELCPILNMANLMLCSVSKHVL